MTIHTTRIFFLLFFIAAMFSYANAQQKDFEGIIVYKNDVKSKSAEISEKDWRYY